MAWCRECTKHFERPEGSLAQRCPRCEARNARVEQWLSRERPRRVATLTLCALNVAVFVVMSAAGLSPWSPTGEQVLPWGASFGPLVLSGEWWRLFTAMFLHLGIVHLALNMWCLLDLGLLAEFLFGRVAFVFLYLLSGLGGGVLSLLVHPTVVAAGASGAIFGVAGGIVVYVWLHRLGFHSAKLESALPAVAVFILYNLYNLWYGFGDAGIDNAAHLGGLMVGGAMGALLPGPSSEPGRFTRLRLPGAVALAGALIVYGGMRAALVQEATVEHHLEQLVELPADGVVDLSRRIDWMRCQATAPTDSTPFDYLCVASDSPFVMSAGTLRAQLSVVHVGEVGAAHPDFTAWAKKRFGVPSDSCAGDTAGLHFSLMWWNRPTVYITVAAFSGPEHSRMQTFTLESRRFNEGPSCDKDAEPDLVRPKAPRRDRKSHGR